MALFLLSQIKPPKLPEDMIAHQLILFDFGGVLFHYVPEVRLKELARRTTWTESELKTTLWISGFSSDCDCGLYTAEEMYREFQRLLSWECDYDEFRALWSLAFVPNDEVVNMTQQLKASGIKIGLMTNNAEILKEHLLNSFPSLMESFDHLFFSYAAKSMKPHREFFDHVVNQTGHKAGELLLIDDSQANVNAAKSYGLNAIHFTDPSHLKAELLI